ncbi:hypothetical protein MNEG_1137 [Monoraphidium neglectum]|jgi:hypothetical protein|uniref:Uncharacterized protein n=1 Tax=Monoraphidium neglectum TaxID=145388 RepID=A0A0D2MW68_9CHLO|nr:hypothetical protein MNEG_1137 [Monoraphidium neglectum]KIZ06820.1 hypothetical protein MNEG_1137 [Monoraphidium neglectum]|eukprot:XP_013905839.1 hypothetical protein MNEG_1137 [Monoraphidium neglectum]
MANLKKEAVDARLLLHIEAGEDTTDGRPSFDESIQNKHLASVLLATPVPAPQQQGLRGLYDRPSEDGEGADETFFRAFQLNSDLFGSGQVFNMFQSYLVWAPSVVLLLLLLSIGSPVATGAWACADPADEGCQAALAGADGTGAGLCGLQRHQWQWAQPSTSLVTKFDLVCDGG